MTTIQVVDYGAGNLRSVTAALTRLGVTPHVVSRGSELQTDAPLILPGVGSAGEAMRCLQAQGMAEQLPRCTAPVLGICLGMQLMLTHSEEGDVETLGIFPGTVRRLRTACKLPHMGWNAVTGTRGAHPLLTGLPNPAHFYFAHSYVADTDSEYVVATCQYDSEIPAMICRKNFWGIQCHPEKSGENGMQLLANFIRMVS
jgi:glutamine amidotransferase